MASGSESERLSLELRLAVARAAVESVGAALLRIPRERGVERGDQLKTAADEAAEGWVVGYLRGNFPDDAILAEEAFGREGGWGERSSFWTVDALDGTRSFAEGYDGYCVQTAWIEAGRVRLGVIREPALSRTYFAIEGGGAFVQRDGDEAIRIRVASWPEVPRFVDSTRPGGIPGEWFRRHSAQFVELGSIGLKIARVAEGTADIFLKALQFKLWDVAPGEIILREAGGRIGTWDGIPIPYDGARTHFRNIVAASMSKIDEVARFVGALEQGA